ncbi:MAG: hypothetical protein HXY40_02160 [Chloroflexi bacterium]|nr:hypothetical protein [Chloroflexota bacterium]
MTEAQLFVEVFPITTEAIPPLTAYAIVAHTDDLLGGKLAYQLRLALPGRWVWAGGRLLTDTPPDPVALIMLADRLKERQPKIFGALESIEQDYGWRPDAHILAEYVVRGPAAELEGAMRAALTDAAGAKLSCARVERGAQLVAWSVAQQPALSLSVTTRIVYDHDLAAYAPTLKHRHDLVGLWVADRTSTLEGEITEIVGNLGKQRSRLLNLTQRDKMQDILRLAGDDEVVVRVQSGRHVYDYPASALFPLVRLQDSERFGLEARVVESALRLKPPLRAGLVKAASDQLKKHGLISSAYSTQNAAAQFTRANYKPYLRFGKGVRPYDAAKLALEGCALGDFARLEQYRTQPLRAAVVNTLNEKIDDFVEALRRKLRSDFGFDIDLARERKVKVLSRTNLENAAKVLEKEAPDIILMFMPDEKVEPSAGKKPAPQPVDEDEDYYSLARYFRELALVRGLPCQVIRSSTVNDPDAMPHVILGILGKSGNLPYVLDEALSYADFIVGLDLIHAEKPNADDSFNVVLSARVYRSDGALLRYVAHTEALMAGEPIPLAALNTLFPLDEMKKKRVLLHYNGQLNGELRALLAAWSNAAKINFKLVEVFQYEAPRVYALDKGKITGAPAGSVFYLGESEALLVSSVTPQSLTAQPLRVRAEGLTIQQAVESLQAFTLLHYGVTTWPKLPVTLYRSEALAGVMARGARPGGAYSVVPWWL